MPLKIRTSFDNPPIPLRDFDWSAVTDNYDGGDPIGRGRTEFMAIFDLLKQLDEKRVGWPDMLDYTISRLPSRNVNRERAGLLPRGLPARFLNCISCGRTLVWGERYADGFRDGADTCHRCKKDAFERNFVEAEESIDGREDRERN
jgi:hypothetical protein